MTVFQRLQDAGSNKKFLCYYHKTYAECSCGWTFASWFPSRVKYRTTVHAAIQHANEVALVELEIKKPSVMLKNTSAAVNTPVKQVTPSEVKKAVDTESKVIRSPRMTVSAPIPPLPDGLLPLPTKLPEAKSSEGWEWAGKKMGKKS